MSLLVGTGPAAAEVSQETLKLLSAPMTRSRPASARLNSRTVYRAPHTVQQGLRHAGLHPCPQRLQQQLPRRLGAGDHKGFEGVGADSGDIVIFYKLMDCKFAVPDCQLPTPSIT